jgi:hypothetical protein
MEPTASQSAEGSQAPKTESPPDPKQLLEFEKLKLEIADLRRSAWFKPAVMIPIVATLVTLGISWGLGVFDVERKRIEVSATELEIRRERLTDDVAKLEKDQQSLEQAKTGLRTQISDLQKQLDYTKNVLSVPSLNIDSYSAFDGARLWLKNVGKGTAKVKVIRLFVDNNPVSTGSTREWIPALDRLGINAPWIHWIWPQDDYISSGSTHILLEVPKEDFSYREADEFGAAMEHLGVEVCYCSDLNVCKWTTYHRPSIEQTMCSLTSK